MRRAVHIAVVTITVLHGLIHLLGTVKAFGWAEVARLQEPISPAAGGAWLVTATIVVAAGVLLAARGRGWWIVMGAAAMVSQAMILTALPDAAAGTAANILMLIAAAYGYASRGPISFRAEYDRHVERALAEVAPGPLVTEEDLQGLPPPVATYVRRSGALGKPRVTAFRAHLHGRIRGGPDQPWMSFQAEQVNTFGPCTTRQFFMDATMAGLPVDVLHVYDEGHASMRARLLSTVTKLDASGGAMDQGETVTVLNDLCLFAPAALVDAPISWEAIDDHRVRARYTVDMQTVSAELVFNDEGDLTDFISDDRLAASPDGKWFTAQRWSTPISRFAELHGRRVAAGGQAIWHPQAPKRPYTYIELELDDIVTNSGGTSAAEKTSPADVEPLPV